MIYTYGIDGLILKRDRSASVVIPAWDPLIPAFQATLDVPRDGTLRRIEFLGYLDGITGITIQIVPFDPIFVEAPAEMISASDLDIHVTKGQEIRMSVTNITLAALRMRGALRIEAA